MFKAKTELAEFLMVPEGTIARLKTSCGDGIDARIKFNAGDDGAFELYITPDNGAPIVITGTDATASIAAPG